MGWALIKVWLYPTMTRHIVSLPKYGHYALIHNQQISCIVRHFVFRGIRLQNKDRPQFLCNKIVFVINVLNNKRIIILNLTEYP